MMLILPVTPRPIWIFKNSSCTGSVIDVLLREIDIGRMKSYGAEPRSIIKGYIRRIIDCTVSSKKQQKVIQLVGEAVDMLNARGFKFDRAKKQADAVRVMRELGHWYCGSTLFWLWKV